MARYRCDICDWVYDEELGCPEEGIAPGTCWQELGDEWVCPDCGATRDAFMAEDFEE